MTGVNSINHFENPLRRHDIEILGGSKVDLIFIANAKQDNLKLTVEIRRLKK